MEVRKKYFFCFFFEKSLFTRDKFAQKEIVFYFGEGILRRQMNSFFRPAFLIAQGVSDKLVMCE